MECKHQSKYARKNTFVEIVCKCCGKKIVMRSRKAKFCSLECKTKYTNDHRPSTSDAPETRLCDVCGKIFKPFSVKSRFCSKECYRLYSQIARTAEKTARNRQRIGTEKKCEFCGENFYPRTEKQKFCSEGCYSNYICASRIASHRRTTITDEIKAEVARRVEHTSTISTCPTCGRKFFPKRVNQQCCSTKCGIAYRAEQKSLDKGKTADTAINQWRTSTNHKPTGCSFHIGTMRRAQMKRMEEKRNV